MPKEVCSKLNTKPKEKLFCPRSCVRYDETICGTCWLCKMCQKCLFSQEAVENHVKDCHPDIPYFLPKTTKENKDYNTYKIRFKCDYCQKMFFRKTTLKYHIKEHIKSEREDSNEVEDHLLTTKI